MRPQVVGSRVSGQANLTESHWPCCDSQLQNMFNQMWGATGWAASRRARYLPALFWPPRLTELKLPEPRCQAWFNRAAMQWRLLETLGSAIYMPPALRNSVGTAHRLGGLMSWNMFSRFGAGSDPEIVSFADLEEAIGTNAWTVVDVRE